jgi:ATP-dependent RNA helicase DDX47/RRP3
MHLLKVDVVVNFDIPTNGKEYIHRVGRTARAGRAGRSLAFVTQYDVEVYQRLEVLLGNKLPEFPADEETVSLIDQRPKRRRNRNQCMLTVS